MQNLINYPCPRFNLVEILFADLPNANHILFLNNDKNVCLLANTINLKQQIPECKRRKAYAKIRNYLTTSLHPIWIITLLCLWSLKTILQLNMINEHSIKILAGIEIFQVSKNYLFLVLKLKTNRITTQELYLKYQNIKFDSICNVHLHNVYNISHTHATIKGQRLTTFLYVLF